MAKGKKKKLKNVQISNEELVPTTIGYLSSRQKGPFLLIFIFAVLFGTLYFMPQITEYYNMIFNPAAYNESKSQKYVVEDQTGSLEALNPDLSLTISGVKFSKFEVKDNELTYTVDATQATGDFVDYYLETYDKNQKLLERILIPSTSVSSLSLTYTNLRFISINHYDGETYPAFNLKNSKLTCAKGDESYEYGFQSGGLSYIKYVVNMTKTEDNAAIYEDRLNKFETESGYDNEGIEIMLSQSEGSFQFVKKENLLITTSSTLDNGFKYQTKADQIAFDLSTKGYKCN